jgi:hypothetical protein
MLFFAILKLDQDGNITDAYVAIILEEALTIEK